MPRQPKQPIVYLSLSPAASAVALNVRPERIADAIADGVLPAYTLGVRRFILVADLEAWVRTWKRVMPRKRKVPHHVHSPR